MKKKYKSWLQKCLTTVIVRGPLVAQTDTHGNSYWIPSELIRIKFSTLLYLAQLREVWDCCVFYSKKLVKCSLLFVKRKKIIRRKIFVTEIFLKILHYKDNIKLDLWKIIFYRRRKGKEHRNMSDSMCTHSLCAYR